MAGALSQQPGVLASVNQPALVSPSQVGYQIPTNAFGTVRDFLSFGFDHLYAPLMDYFNRTALTPEQHQAAMSDPDFAQAAQNWANYMNYYRNVVNP